MSVRLLQLVCLLAALGGALAGQHDGFEKRWQEAKATLSNDEFYRLMWAVPKGGDIHNHHEYSIPMRFWLDSAIRKNYYVRYKTGGCPEEKDPIQWVSLRKQSVGKLPACEQGDYVPAASLSEAQRRDWISALTLGSSHDVAARNEFFERIVMRLGDLELDAELMAEALVVAQKQLQAENAVYLETQADPRSFLDLTQDQAADVLRRRLSMPVARKTGVTVRMQVSTLRFRPGAEADLRDGFAFVHRNRDLWAGVNLVGREDNPEGRPARFEAVLRELRGQYPEVLLSLHAGESSERDSHVAETIELLGARRIGHGTNAYLDPAAIEKLRSRRYLVEVSLVSNQMLGYMPDLRRHPFPLYLRQGIPVCLNTDDRGVMDSNLTDEYFAAVSLFDLSWAEVVRIGRLSLEHSFAEAPLRKALLGRYAENVKAFERKYSAADWRQRLARTPARPSGATQPILALRGK